MPVFNANPPFGPLFPQNTGGDTYQDRTIFAGMSIPQVQAWYTIAQAQYLALIAGGKPVTVSYEGKSVTYTPADVARFRATLDEAQKILGFGRQRRALRPIFR